MGCGPILLYIQTLKVPKLASYNLILSDQCPARLYSVNVVSLGEGRQGKGGEGGQVLVEGGREGGGGDVGGWVGLEVLTKHVVFAREHGRHHSCNG